MDDLLDARPTPDQFASATWDEILPWYDRLAAAPLDASTAAASAGPRHAELSRAALRGYALSGDDETHAVRLLGATFHGYAALDAAGAFSHGGPSAPSSDDTWERVIDGLDTLLRSWETR